MSNRGSFYWRKTSGRPNFLWMFDYLTVGFVLLFILHMRSWTFWLAIGAMVFFSILAKFGFTIPLLLRRLGFVIGGRSRPARGWWHWDRIDSNND